MTQQAISASSKSKGRGVRNPDTKQDELKYLNGTSMLSWRQIARLDEYSGIPPGTLCTYAKTGYLPNRYRQRLGLPAVASVAPVMEPIPNGAQALFALRCECGRWYISNHPRRKRCFVCSPYKRSVTSA